MMGQETDYYEIAQGSIARLKARLEKGDEAAIPEVCDTLLDAELSHMHHSAERVQQGEKLNTKFDGLTADFGTLSKSLEPLIKDYDNRTRWTYTKVVKVIRDLAGILAIIGALMYGIMQQYFVDVDSFEKAMSELHKEIHD